MNFIVNQMVQFQHINYTYCNFLIKRLTGSAIKENRLSCFGQTGIIQQFPDFIFRTTVKNRTCYEHAFFQTAHKAFDIFGGSFINKLCLLYTSDAADEED